MVKFSAPDLTLIRRSNPIFAQRVFHNIPQDLILTMRLKYLTFYDLLKSQILSGNTRITN
jgi:hypothetical protein